MNKPTFLPTVYRVITADIESMRNLALVMLSIKISLITWVDLYMSSISYDSVSVM